MRVASVRDLQTLARRRRKGLGLTQDELAARMGVSRKWVYTFETGSPNAVELSIVLRLLAALGLVLDVDPPDAALREPSMAGAPSIDLHAHLADIVHASRVRERTSPAPHRLARADPEPQR